MLAINNYNCSRNQTELNYGKHSFKYRSITMSGYENKIFSGFNNN